MINMMPYYISDIIPGASRGLTLHGAWSHYPNGAFGGEWKMVVTSGVGVFRAAVNAIFSQPTDYLDDQKFWKAWHLKNPGKAPSHKDWNDALVLLFEQQSKECS